MERPAGLVDEVVEMPSGLVLFTLTSARYRPSRTFRSLLRFPQVQFIDKDTVDIHAVWQRQVLVILCHYAKYPQSDNRRRRRKFPRFSVLIKWLSCLLSYRYRLPFSRSCMYDPSPRQLLFLTRLSRELALWSLVSTASPSRKLKSSAGNTLCTLLSRTSCSLDVSATS